MNSLFIAYKNKEWFHFVVRIGPPAGHLGDQVIGSSRDVRVTLVKRWLSLPQQVSQGFIVNGSSKKFRE